MQLKFLLVSKKYKTIIAYEQYQIAETGSTGKVHDAGWMRNSQPRLILHWFSN